ncbi:hypothetical protein DIPPA_32838 [Diplonema papillatum]|nr:hypothetical protein DIPPA_32838 [Diplonema papillatum]
MSEQPVPQMDEDFDSEINEESDRDGRPLPAFKWSDAACWASGGAVSTIIGWAYCAFDQSASACSWWVATLCIPPLFFAIGVAFDYFVIEKRRHRILCCCSPRRWMRTGWALVGIQVLILLVGVIYVVEDMRGQCAEPVTLVEAVVLTTIGCALLLSVFKDIFSVLPPPPPVVYSNVP